MHKISDRGGGIRVSEYAYCNYASSTDGSSGSQHPGTLPEPAYLRCGGVISSRASLFKMWRGDRWER